MGTGAELMASLTEPPPPGDLQRLEGEAAWMLRTLEFIRAECPEAMEGFPGRWIGTECVMWQVRERLATGTWQDVEYDRWLERHGRQEAAEREEYDSDGDDDGDELSLRVLGRREEDREYDD